MRKILKFLSLFIVVAFAGSCASDNAALDDLQNDGDTISFTFSGMNYGGITYAIATAPENQADNLDVYMFEYAAGGSGTFHRKWTSGDADFTVTQAGLTQTISLGNGNAYGPGLKKFYFVANPNPTTALDASGKTEAEFVESLTEQLAITDGKGDLLATPLLFTGNSDEIDPLNPISAAVTMKRRVARFDIVNEYENFVVEKVLVSNAKLQGYIFGNAQGTGSPVIPTASLKEITTIPDYVNDNNERISRSVFYLYPTTISNTETEIAIQASLNGEPSDLYYLDPAASAMAIDANHRYKLVIHKDIVYGTYSFDLVYVDWDEGKTVDVKVAKKMNIADVNFDPNHDDQLPHWDANKQTLDMGKSSATKMTFTINNPLNLTWEAKVIKGDPAHVEKMPVLISTPTLTYGAEASHACEVTLPEYSDAMNDDVTIQLRIRNSARLEEYTDIFFKKEIPRINLAFKRSIGKDKDPVDFTAEEAPYGLRVSYFPLPGEPYDRKLDYDRISWQDASKGSPFNTQKENITQGWTIVSWAYDPNLEWKDYHAPGDNFDLKKVEAAVKKHPKHPGYYMPLASNSRNLWWQYITISQGKSVENPFVVAHTQTTAKIKVIVENIEKAKHPTSGGKIDPSKLWLAIDGQARACDFLADETVVRTGLPLGVSLAIDNPTINGTTATWDYFGTFGTITGTTNDNDPSRIFGIRIMYGNNVLASKKYTHNEVIKVGVDHVFTIKLEANNTISISINIDGWEKKGGGVVVG